MTDVFELRDEIESAGFLEDRREYQPEDLALMYTLTEQEAADLHHLIQREFDPKMAQVPALEDCEPALVLEAIVEGWHAGMDGWTSHERAVILAFCDDLRLYTHAAANISEGPRWQR